MRIGSLIEALDQFKPGNLLKNACNVSQVTSTSKMKILSELLARGPILEN